MQSSTSTRAVVTCDSFVLSPAIVSGDRWRNTPPISCRCSLPMAMQSRCSSAVPVDNFCEHYRQKVTARQSMKPKAPMHKRWLWRRAQTRTSLKAGARKPVVSSAEAPTTVEFRDYATVACDLDDNFGRGFVTLRRAYDSIFSHVGETGLHTCDGRWRLSLCICASSWSMDVECSEQK